MIIADVRHAIAAIAEQARTAAGLAARVYQLPPDGTVEFPAIVVGPAGWEPGENAYVQRWTITLDVVVAQPGISEAATVGELDALWPVVLAAVQDQIDYDQSLGGIAVAARVTRARPGTVLIAGVRYPATSIEIEIYG